MWAAVGMARAVGRRAPRAAGAVRDGLLTLSNHLGAWRGGLPPVGW